MAAAAISWLLFLTSVLLAPATAQRSSVCVVMDTTASMGDDVEEVCRVMSDLTPSLSRSFNEFCFVPFNDHGGRLTPYGPVQSERSGEALRRTVCGWRNRIDGGGDCPELTLSGLVLALQNSAPDSVIVVFTDASAKDMDKLGEVLQLIREKRIKVYFLLSGHCGNPQGAGYMAYYTISATSGGQVYILRELDIPALLRVLLSSQGTIACPSNPVLISRSNPVDWSSSFIVPTERSTLTAQVSCLTSRPVVDLTPAVGVVRVNLPNGMLLSTKNPPPGLYRIRIRSSSSCSVIVSTDGCGAYARVYGFSESRTQSATSQPTGRLSLIHIQSQPNVMITGLRFLSPAGAVLGQRTVRDRTTDASGRVTIGRYALPGEPFRLELTGVDSSRRSFVSLSSVTYTVPITTALGEIPASNRFETTLCSEVMIRCSVQLQDQLIPVTWAKDGQVLSSDGRKELSGTRGEQLKIKYVLSSDEGIYTCEPATATGARTSASIYMRVRDGGRRDEDCGKCTELTCPASPVLEWSHNNTRLASNSNYKIVNPNILQSCRTPLHQRAGVYRCVTAGGSWSFTVSTTFSTAIGSTESSFLRESTVLGGCQAFGGIVNGEITYTAQENGNARAEFRCNRGLALRGSAVSLCRAQQWSSPAPTCECNQIFTVTNGRVTYATTSTGSRATFTCNNGYVLIGQATSECVTGRWTNSNPPICIPRPTTAPPVPRVNGGCEYFPSLANGRISYTARGSGTRALFFCNDGYELDDLTFSDCVSGRWTSSNPPICLLKPTPPPVPRVNGGCEYFPSLANGRISYTARGSGTRALFLCNDGYELDDLTFSDCVSGRWTSSNPPICLLKPTPPPVPRVNGGCEYYSPVANGRVTYTTRGLGTRAEFACNSGYELGGLATSDCASGRWSSASQPFCLLQPTTPPVPRVNGGCEYFSSVVNGGVTYNTQNAGTRATFFCNRGYDLVGSSTSNCVSGSWSSSSPAVCVLAPTTPPVPRVNGGCEYFPTVANGDVAYSTYSCATRATFTCNAGYQLQGSATSYCLVGEWSSAAATCVVEPTTQAPVEVPTVPGGCLPFEPVANGALSTFSLGEVTIMSLVCNEGYQAEGSSSSICRSGSWSPDRMSCVPGPTTPAPTTPPPTTRPPCRDAILQRQNINLRRQLTSVATTLSRIQDAANQKDTTISKLTDELESIRASLTVLKMDNDEKDQQIATLTATLGENTRLKTQVSTLEVRVDSLMEDNSGLTANIETITGERSDCLTKLTAVGVALGTCPAT